jgi:hypothetical protein
MTRAEYVSNAIIIARRGLDLTQSKLSPELVREIRINRHGLTAKAQATKYGVHYRTIEKVRHYETWRHIND